MALIVQVNKLLGTGTNEPVSIIQLSPKMIEYGEIMVGNSLQKRLTIKNETTATAELNVTDIISSNPAFTSTPTSFTLTPGDSQEVIITFTPAEIRSYNDTLSIYHNGSDSPSKIELLGTGTNEPVSIIQLSPKMIEYGEIIVGNSLQKRLTIKNETTATAELKVTDIISSNPVFTSTPTSFTLTPGDSQEVIITFTPAEIRSYNDTLSIYHNGSDSPNKINLTGGGTIDKAAMINLSTSVLDFGETKLNNSISKSFYIKNIGTDSLYIFNISIINNMFSIVGLKTFKVAASDSQKVSINFKPTEPGNYSSVMTIEHNAKNNPSHIDISGKGFDYPATLSLNYTKSFSNIIDSSSYRIIGIPGNSIMPISQIITGEYGKDWEAYWDIGIEGNKSDYLLARKDYTFSPGKAYWVLSRNTIIVENKSVAPVPLNTTDNSYSIALNNGWNLISTPFEKTTSWYRVKSVNKLDSNQILYSWNGEWSYPNSIGSLWRLLLL